MLSTIDEIEAWLRSHVTERRFLHSKGVARAMGMLFSRFGQPDEGQRSFMGMEAADFVGLMHDAAREYSDAHILRFAAERGLKLPVEMQEMPMLAHGMVAHHLALELVSENLPPAWLTAMDWHTTGSIRMGYMGLALFIADYLEPGRAFLDDARREVYLDHDDMNKVAEAILDDTISHLRSKGVNPSASSLELQSFFKAGMKIR